MILILATKDEILQVFDKENVAFDFAGISFSLSGNIPLQISFLQEQLPLRPGMTVELLEGLRLSVFGMDDGFDTITVYQRNKHMTIGGSIEDDIYLMDRRFPPSSVLMDQDRITVMADIAVGRNGCRVSGECSFSEEDVFVIGMLRFVILGQWLIVRKGAGVHIRLPQGMPHPEKNERIEQDNLTPLPWCSGTLSRRITIALEEPLAIQDRIMNPLAFQMGPAVTMALASCAAGFLTVQQALDSGRPWIQVLPSLVLPLTMLVSTLLWLPLQRLYEKHQHKKHLCHRHQQYAAYLSSVRQEICSRQDTYAQQAEKLFLIDRKMPLFRPYQKMRQRNDWMMVCLGRGNEVFEPDFQQLFRFRHGDALSFRVQAVKDDCKSRMETPMILSLLDDRCIRIREGDDAVLKSIVLQYIWYFPIEQAGIAVICDPLWLDCHRWIYELPHTQLDGIRLIALNDIGLRRIRGVLASQPKKHFLILCPDTVVDLCFPHVTILDIKKDDHVEPDGSLCISQKNGSGVVYQNNEERTFQINPYFQDPWAWLYRLRSFWAMKKTESQETFLDLYPHLHLKSLRQQASPLAAAIGWNREGERIMLDFSEEGHGPHGLVAGMTGSGKSEVLLTILLSMMVTHSPKDLQFVLIDFKGGGLVQVLQKDGRLARHIACAINNLETKEMRRALAGLAQQCRYRQQCFQTLSARCHQPIFHLRTYQQLAERYGMEPLPYLLVVVDEFAQLKKEHPEFLRELMALARTGRSLGLHLLLATQKPGGIIDEQIQSNCRFRICLKVQSRSDSMETLQHPDAADLQRPGDFYFLCDGSLERGRAAYSGAPLHAAKEVNILNEQMDVTQTIRPPGHLSPSQASFVLEKLLEEDEGYSARPLWMHLPDAVTFTSQGRPLFGIGMMDDIEACELPWYVLSKEGTLIQALDESIRVEMLRTIRNVLAMDAKQEDVIVLVAQQQCSSWLESSGHDFIFIADEEEERMERMSRIVHEQRSRFFWLLVAEGARVFEDDGMRRIFLRLLKEEGGHCGVIVLVDAIESVPHAIACRLPQRISFCHNDRQQAVRVLAGSVDYLPMHPDGLVRFEEKVMPCRFILSRSLTPIHRQGTCLLALIPERIPLEETQSQVLLGYSMRTMEKVFWQRKQKLLILASYEEELEVVRPFFVHECFSFLPFSNYEGKSSSAPVLFIGEGFQEQFLFRMKGQRPLRFDEGILFQGMRKEVIRLVNCAPASGVSTSKSLD